MKKNFYTYFVLVIIMSVVFVMPTQAQSRHLYNRVELGAGNVWTFVGMETVSTIINTITHRPLTEGTLRFGIPISEYGNLNGYQGFDDWNYDRFNSDPDYEYGNDGFVKFKTRNLLSNIIIGDKLGYLSDNLSSVNYCIYGAAYYNLQQFKLMSDYENYDAISTQRMQLGGGFMLTFGSIESKNRIIVDGGLRYNIPLHFGGDIEGKTNEMMNKGITSHYMFKYSWDNSVAIGFTVDLMHYNMFKDESLCGNQSKLVEFGITASILFKQ